MSQSFKDRMTLPEWRVSCVPPGVHSRDIGGWYVRAKNEAQAIFRAKQSGMTVPITFQVYCERWKEAGQ